MILVDRPIWSAHGMRFAHLVSDRTLDELHGFASHLGLPARAFHLDHYDLPDRWWPKAIELGATEVDPRVLARRLRGSGLRVPPAGRRPERLPELRPGYSPEAQAFQNAR